MYGARAIIAIGTDSVFRMGRSCCFNSKIVQELLIRSHGNKTFPFLVVGIVVAILIAVIAILR